jgi:uncharacterized FlgJ-related protein
MTLARIPTLKDTAARHTAFLDQLQAKLDANRTRLSEDDVCQIQKEINRYRLDIQREKFQIEEIISRFK